MRKILAPLAAAIAGGALLAGCSYEKVTERVVPAPPTTVVVNPPQKVVTYPEGRYELRGDGTTVPYYWVWTPTGVVVPAPPPPPLPSR